MNPSDENAEPLFFVLGLDGSHGDIGPPYQDCHVVERWHLPYKNLYGPASKKQCEEFIRNNCETCHSITHPPTPGA
jgi:hypothetical protein